MQCTAAAQRELYLYCDALTPESRDEEQTVHRTRQSATETVFAHFAGW